jgi:hypothetical protein
MGQVAFQKIACPICFLNPKPALSRQPAEKIKENNKVPLPFLDVLQIFQAFTFVNWRFKKVGDRPSISHNGDEYNSEE